MDYIGKRISILKKPDETSIVILSWSEKQKTRLLLLWLIAWTACGIIIFAEYFGQEDREVKTALIVWLAFWFYFEYTILKAFRWRKGGKEKIKIKPGILTLKKEINGKGKISVYKLDFIKDLRIFEEKNNFIRSLNKSYWVVAGETISFTYYGKEVLFGLQLEDKDARELFGLINHSIKQFENIS